VDHATLHIDPFDGRLAANRLDKPQPGSRTWWLKIQTAVWPDGVVVTEVLGQHPT